MNSADPQAPVRVAGFTLVEALAATLLMSIILAALATITAQWLPNWNRGFHRVQRAELVDIAIERMVADLAAAEFIPPDRKNPRPLFEGSELSVTFVRSAFGPNSGSGLEIVRIAEAADRLGPALVRARARFVPTVSPADQTFFSDPVVLLRAPYRVTFAFAGPDQVWTTSWVGVPRLPSAIRLAIRDAATGQALAVSTATTVHAQVPAECVTKKDGHECGRRSRDGAGDKPETDARGGNEQAGSR
jgi:general secretion pathway protein J